MARPHGDTTLVLALTLVVTRHNHTVVVGITVHEIAGVAVQATVLFAFIFHFGAFWPEVACWTLTTHGRVGEAQGSVALELRCVGHQLRK